MNGNTNVLNVGWEGEEKEEIEPIPINRSELHVTPAMTHSRGRSCHGEEGVEGAEEGEEWADVRVHRGRRPYGPWGTIKARVTKGACSPVVPSSNLSGKSVAQSLSPPQSLSLSPGPAQECAFCKPTHTHSHTRGVSSPSVVSYYRNGWCKECCAIENARVQRKHNRQMRRRLQAAQRSSLCWTMASSTAINPVPPPRPPPPMVSDFAPLISSSESKRFPRH